MSKICPFIILAFLAILLAGCSQSSNSSGPLADSPAGQAVESADLVEDIPTINPTAAMPTRTTTPVPASSPIPTATASPTASATPHPLRAYTIPAYQARDFPGGPVQILNTVEQNPSFTRSYMACPSCDLTITGTMHMPTGSGPFPVLILLHGYFVREQYYAGADTWQAAEFFAQQGYLVLAPDLRSWGASDAGLSLFHMGLTADVLHLISALNSIPGADPERVGLWGHSMGGGIATKILTIDDRVQAAVLYAPNSADDADLIARWGPGCLPGQSEAAGDNWLRQVYRQTVRGEWL